MGKHKWHRTQAPIRKGITLVVRKGIELWEGEVINYAAFSWDSLETKV